MATAGEVALCDGVAKRVLRAGTGPVPAPGALVRVHYTGTLRATGEEFDSSRGTFPHTMDGITVIKKKQPLKFTLGAGAVIAGWEVAVASMALGERAAVTIAAGMAYGAEGAGEGRIRGDLVFDMELVGVDKQFYTPPPAGEE